MGYMTAKRAAVTVAVYEQEFFGEHHFRVMRRDGRLIFGEFQTGFPTEADALAAIRGVFRRKLTRGKIEIHRLTARRPMCVEYAI